MHASETESEVQDCIGRYGMTPTALFEQLGLWNYGGGAFHSVWVSNEDLNIYKKHGVYAVLNAGSQRQAGQWHCPGGKNVANGHSPGGGHRRTSSNNALDMFREMYLICVLQKLREKNAAAADANAILKAATAGSARCMGLPEADCIAPGKLADLTVIDLHRPNMQPINNITKNLVYSGALKPMCA